MKRFEVTVKAGGETIKRIQPAQTARQATQLVKAFYYSGQDVKTTVKAA